MQVMIEAVLSNAGHPEYGVATIPLPIPRGQYDHCVELLEALEIGDASKADCHLDDLWDAWPVLNRLQGTQVNLDELDYLVKRLDGFDVGELSQFQAMAEKLDLTSMKDLINLTFCCQQVTVVTDFSDLEAVGRDHYLNTHGGCAGVEELEQLDGEETAILLITDNEGTITRYGVVYDNGMKLSQIYDGKHLPCYHYEPDIISVGISSQQEPENCRDITWVYLPASKGQIERAMRRSGITDPRDMCLWMGDSLFPEEVDAALDFRRENIHELNALALAVGKLSNDDRRKLGAAVSMENPECARQIRRLAENLDLAVIGRVSFADGCQMEYTNAAEYLRCVREELPLQPVTGFRYETLTDDPAIRKQVDDILYDLYGEKNPHQINDYENKPNQDMQMGGM